MSTDHKQRVTIPRMVLSALLAILPSLAFGASNSEFETFDLNQDKQLSSSEFVAAKYSIGDFKLADRNQNQSISISEFATFKTSLSKPQARPSSGPHPPHG